MLECFVNHSNSFLFVNEYLLLWKTYVLHMRLFYLFIFIYSYLFIQYLFIQYLFTQISLSGVPYIHLFQFVYVPPPNIPDIHLLLNAAYSFVHFFSAYMYISIICCGRKRRKHQQQHLHQQQQTKTSKHNNRQSKKKN